MCKQKGLNFANAIHPSAIIAKNVQIGTGIFIAAGVIINTGSKIENNIILNTHSSIDHDCIIKNHAQIMPGSTLAGNVTVEELGVVGSGATIIPGKQIGVNSYVGAGAVVTKDVDKNTIVTGIPAKLLKKNDVKKK